MSAHSDGVGRGSEFAVRLPAARVTATEAGAARPAVGASATAGKGLRVLVVDDNEDAAEMLAQILTMKGHDVRVAHDGPAALHVCEEFKPAVALLDIGLPIMDGYELAERLRGISGLDHLRLIAITGYGQPADRQRSRAAGFDMHLVKPVDVEALDASLAAAVPR